MKRLIAYFVLITLLISTCTMGVFADASTTKALTQKKIMVYLKPDVTIELNSVKYIFKDVNGQVVYPIVYNGSTYLPIRAISELMKEPVEWDGPSKTVFIGKTLSDPSKSKIGMTTGSAIAVDDSYAASAYTPLPSTVSAYLKPDVLIMFDFVMQTFQDVNGATVYPIIYNGSTYLPIRAISKLMKEPVEWDRFTKTVIIGDGEDEVIVVEEKKSLATIKMLDIFEREETLYYEATAKISIIQKATSLEEKQLIATAISENYHSAQEMTAEIKGLNQTAFTAEELITYEKLLAFVESTEYYILILENIAYIAASGGDYSMLAETFLYFALDSQAKMDAARP